jgi:hypothetical protein
MWTRKPSYLNKQKDYFIDFEKDGERHPFFVPFPFYPFVLLWKSLIISYSKHNLTLVSVSEPFRAKQAQNAPLIFSPLANEVFPLSLRLLLPLTTPDAPVAPAL